MNRWLQPGLIAAPGLLLGIVGATHPAHLTHASAHQWFVMHVAGVLVFPLVGVALVWLVRGRRDAVAAAAVLAAYVYATCYTALDVLSGAGAGYVTERLGEGAPRPDAVRLMFHLGSRLGDVGAWALLVAAVLIGADAVRRLGPRALPPALLLMVGSWLLRTQHIFPPWGALGCAAIGLGTGWLAWMARPGDRVAGVRSGPGR